MPQIKTSQESTAYHEAGHAVADWRYGFKIKTITIVPTADAVGSVTSKTRLKLGDMDYAYPSSARIARNHEMIVALLAGGAAQRRFNPKGIRSHHSSSDLEKVKNLVSRLHSEGEEYYVRRYLEERSWNLVNHPQNWRLIQDLAKALLEHRTMSGTEVEALLRASMANQIKEHAAKTANSNPGLI